MRDIKSTLLKIIVLIITIILVAIFSVFIFNDEEVQQPPVNSGEVQEENQNGDKDVIITNKDDENKKDEEEKVEVDDKKDDEKSEESNTTPNINNNLIANNNQQNSVVSKPSISRPSISDTVKPGNTTTNPGTGNNTTNKPGNNNGNTGTNKPGNNNGNTGTNKPGNNGNQGSTGNNGGSGNLGDNIVDKEEEEIVYVTPSAVFSVNGATNAKSASTKIIASGDYTKVEYAVSTSNNPSTVKTWNKYVKGQEIKISRNYGNVYVLVRLTAKKDNSYVYVVSRVFNMAAWVEPSATFTTNGASGVRAATTKIVASGEYTKVEYAISTSNNPSAVAIWNTYSANQTITITNDYRNAYVLVRLTFAKDGTYRYVVSNVFSMLQWVEPTARFTTNGVSGVRETSTQIVASGDCTRIEYAISTSNNPNSVTSWNSYTAGQTISISNDRGNVYVIARLTFAKDNTYRYSVSNVFSMLAWVEPSATFTTNGANNVKEASTKITASGDYNKVEYAISTSNNVNDVTSWNAYTAGQNIAIPNDRGNVYVLVRIRYTKDNTYRYAVSNVFNMLPWEAPTATFTVNGNLTAANGHTTAINVTGDYSSIMYGLATQKSENAVLTWINYTNNARIDVPNATGKDVYVIAKVTDKLGNVTYVYSNYFKMTEVVLLAVRSIETKLSKFDPVAMKKYNTCTITLENNLNNSVTRVTYSVLVNDVEVATGEYDRVSESITTTEFESTTSNSVKVIFTIYFNDGTTVIESSEDFS